MANNVKDCKLSDDLRYWRAERPDEWTMDRFIRKAEALEVAQTELSNRSDKEENNAC